MAKAYNACCLVLNHTKLGETDTIVTLLSSEGGQIRAVAKGLRKPGNKIGARLELFSKVNALFNEGKSLDIVREVKILQANTEIQTELERVACAHVVAEFLDKTGRDGALLGNRIFEMSATTFKFLSDVSSEQAPLIASAFMFKAMAMQGFAPAVRECALCGSTIEDDCIFDVSHGGALCQNCIASSSASFNQNNWQKDWIEALLYCTFAELDKLKDYPALKLLELAHSWIQEHAGIKLKSMTFLKSLL